MKTFNNPFAPSLYAIVAEATLICKVLLQTKTTFGTLFQIYPLKDSFTFCVYPCKHFFNKVSDPRSSWENTFFNSITNCFWYANFGYIRRTTWRIFLPLISTPGFIITRTKFMAFVNVTMFWTMVNYLSNVSSFRINHQHYSVLPFHNNFVTY